VAEGAVAGTATAEAKAAVEEARAAKATAEESVEGCAPRSFEEEYREAIKKYKAGQLALRHLGRGVLKNHKLSAEAFFASSKAATRAAAASIRERPKE